MSTDEVQVTEAADPTESPGPRPKLPRWRRILVGHRDILRAKLGRPTKSRVRDRLQDVVTRRHIDELEGAVVTRPHHAWFAAYRP